MKPRRVDVRAQHRVEDPARETQPQPEGRQVDLLQLVPFHADPRESEEPAQGLAAGRVLRGQGECPGGPVGNGDGRGERHRRKRPAGGRLDVDGESPVPEHPPRQRLQLVRGGEPLRGLEERTGGGSRNGTGLRFPEGFLAQPVESELLVEGGEALPPRVVGRLEAERRHQRGGRLPSGGRAVAADDRELPGAERLGASLLEVLPALPLHLGEAAVQLVEGAELGDQLLRPLLADPRDARDVVGGVPHERENVDHPVGGGPEQLGDPLRVEDDLLRRMPDDEPVAANELEEVLVRRDDLHPEPGPERPLRERADQVVRLETRLLDDGEPHRLAEQPGIADLRDEVVGHRGALSLVVLVHLVAERLFLPVERDRHGVGPALREELPEHVREPERRVRRTAPRPGEAPDGEERSIEQTGGVDEREGRRSQHWWSLIRVT